MTNARRATVMDSGLTRAAPSTGIFINYVSTEKSLTKVLNTSLLDQLISTRKSVQYLHYRGRETTFIHQKHEHGRAWWANRNDLACKLNRCCDRAAGMAVRFDGAPDADGDEVAASGGAWHDERSTVHRADQPAFVVTRDHVGINSALNEEIGKAVNLTKAAHLASRDDPIGATIKQMHAGTVCGATTMKCRELMTPRAYEAAMRALVGQSNVSAREMRITSSMTDAGKAAARTFKAMGNLSTKCPFCAYWEEDGTLVAHEDTLVHLRFECKDPGAVAARRSAEAGLSEMILREGRVGSGDPEGKYSTSIKPDDTGTPIVAHGVIWDTKGSDKAADGTMAELTAPGLTQLRVAGIRIRCLAQGILGDALARNSRRKEDSFAGLTMRALNSSIDATAPGPLTWAGQIHPNYKKWFVEVLQISGDALITPCMTTHGIFPKIPTLLSASVPTADRPHWKTAEGEAVRFEGITADGKLLETMPWDCSRLVCIRADAKTQAIGSDKYNNYVTSVLNRAACTAQQGFKCVVLLEMTKGNIALIDRVSNPPAGERGGFYARTLLRFPKGSTLWTGSEGWGGAFNHGAGRMTAPHGTEEDGVGRTRRTEGGEPVGFNDLRLEAILFGPRSTPVDAIPAKDMPIITGEEIRELALIVANSSRPVTPTGLGEPVRLCKWGDGSSHSWVDLSLRFMRTGPDLNPLAAGSVYS